MKKSKGFSTLEILIATTLFTLILSYTIPFVVRSTRDLSRLGRRSGYIDAGLVSAVRIREEMTGAKSISVLSPTELQMEPASPEDPFKKIRWEHGVIRIHRGSYIYPITAVGDVKSVHFEEEAPDRMWMHWDRMKLPLR